MRVQQHQQQLFRAVRMLCVAWLPVPSQRRALGVACVLTKGFSCLPSLPPTPPACLPPLPACVAADIISLCHTVDMKEGIQRAGTQFAYQGNMDSGVLFGSQETITQRVRQNTKEAREMGVRHVLNLGHGIMQVGEWVGGWVLPGGRGGRLHAFVAVQASIGLLKRARPAALPAARIAHALSFLPARAVLCRAPPRRMWSTSSRWPRRSATQTCEQLAPADLAFADLAPPATQRSQNCCLPTSQQHTAAGSSSSWQPPKPAHLEGCEAAP